MGINSITKITYTCDRCGTNSDSKDFYTHNSCGFKDGVISAYRKLKGGE